MLAESDNSFSDFEDDVKSELPPFTNTSSLNPPSIENKTLIFRLFNIAEIIDSFFSDVLPKFYKEFDVQLDLFNLLNNSLIIFEFSSVSTAG
ncbi:238_t:CDS:2 [Funneliformis mosseae]|uniref:238_t:CDS:1 n=1 Tax=Funneliformis mosseae TaxID=27381 RepID=A0A9N9FRR2_FUNMO|nr:238_t:CDS:2 [Funneliformis mosseae]